ncbi:MAG TPA: BON domain-containing protein [Phycisphaeraceae bacterium]
MKSFLAAGLLSLTLLSLGGCVLAFGNGTDHGDTGYSWNDGDSDTSLARTVRARLDGDAQTHDADFSVSTDDGRVYLSGVITNPEALSRAVQLVMDTPDVKSVRCRVTIIK